MSPVRSFVNAMREVGCDADSPWDLVNRRTSYRSAVPVLLEWLDHADEDVPIGERHRFREGLVRALAVKEARGGAAAAALVREFRRPELNSSTRWAVANSLSVVADESVCDDRVRRASGLSCGRAREMWRPGLARADKERAVDVLVEMLDDGDVAGHAIGALGTTGAREALPAIEQFLDHPKPWVRKEAKKVSAKLATGR